MKKNQRHLSQLLLKKYFVASELSTEAEKLMKTMTTKSLLLSLQRVMFQILRAFQNIDLLYVSLQA